MVFIPFLVFVLVPDFHPEPKRLRMTRTRGTELKPFLTILGTNMRALENRKQKLRKRSAFGY
jgi:hypothetical protein